MYTVLYGKKGKQRTEKLEKNESRSLWENNDLLVSDGKWFLIRHMRAALRIKSRWISWLSVKKLGFDFLKARSLLDFNFFRCLTTRESEFITKTATFTITLTIKNWNIWYTNEFHLLRKLYFKMVTTTKVHTLYSKIPLFEVIHKWSLH